MQRTSPSWRIGTAKRENHSADKSSSPGRTFFMGGSYFPSLF